MQTRYKYRFYPTNQQKQYLAQLFGCVRYVWNEALNYCQQIGNYIGYKKLGKRLTNLKQQTAWLREVSSIALQQALRHLDKAYKNHFSGKGKPRFKKKVNGQSAVLMSNGFSIQNQEVYLAKIGTVKPVWSRKLPSSPSSVTIIKDCGGRYFLSFVVEIQPLIMPAKATSVGIDLGIKVFAAMSNGKKAHSPDYAVLYQRIAQLQKKLARQTQGSNRRAQTRLRIAKLHNRIADLRQDFLHKLSTKVVRHNQVIALEDLNVSGMLKNRKLAKAISKQGWGKFRQLCTAKAEKYGRELHIISRWEATSQVCSDCGWHWGKLDLSIRKVVCENCDNVHDRDENASKNIEAVGMGHRLTLNRTSRDSKSCDEANLVEVSRIPAVYGR